ncbi:MAG: hypothetical protein AAF533_03990 [Acidobacteriota bacterium]
MKTRPFSLPCAVADTQAGPVMRWERSDLTLSFTDYQDEPCCLRFEDVPHFELLADGELDGRVFFDDGAVEVLGSPVMAKLVEVGALTDSEAEAHRHVVIGFNEIGSFLSIVYRNMVVIGD